MQPQYFTFVIGSLLLSGCSWVKQSSDSIPELSSDSSVEVRDFCKFEDVQVENILDESSDKLVRIMDKRRSEDKLIHVVKLADDVTLTANISGCGSAESVLKFDWTHVPDGGAGLAPMYRLANLIFNIPSLTAPVKDAIEKMGSEALSLSSDQDYGGESGGHESTCGGRRCQFSWQRASDGALNLSAIISSKGK